MSDMKPCPFCKNDSAHVSHTEEKCCCGEDMYNPAWTVTCDVNKGGCGASCGHWHEAREEAIKAWNTRAGEDDE